MSQIDRLQFKSLTASLYADNSSGDISAADLREQMDNIADSASFITSVQTTAPGATDDGDNTAGNGAYSRGDIWIDVTSDSAYICVDSVTNAAVWSKISALSGSEIKSVYESESDTNAFTDALLNKLQGIESSADVTDSTNVAAAGALMVGDVTNVAQIKSFDSANYATAAQGALADSAVQPQDIANNITSNPAGVSGANAITNIISLTQSDYDAILAPDPSTFYVIV